MATDRFAPHEPDATPDIATSSDRSFGLTFSAVFLIIGSFPLFYLETPRWWAYGIAAVFAGLSLVRPSVLKPLNKLWTRFGLLLQIVVSPLVLGLVFFLVVTPTGLIFRLLRRDLLRLKTSPEATTYWIERDPPGPEPHSMIQPF